MLDLDLTTLRLFVAVCEHASMSRAAEARAGHLVTVPLAEPWAERRFVICHRDDDGLSAAAQELLQALCQAAAQRERAAHTQHRQQVAAHLHDPTP